MKKTLKIKFLSCFYFLFFNLLNILIYNIHLRYSLYSLKIFIFLNDYQYVVFLHNTNLNPLAENFTQEEIGEPILDTELVAGDVLYFPRGTIHQVSNFLSWGAPKSTNSWTCTLSTFTTGSICNFSPGAIIFSCIFKIFFFVLVGKEFVTWPSQTTAVKEAVWLGGKGAELVIQLPRVQALHPTMHWICSCLPQVHLLYCALYNVYNLSASCQLGFLNLYWLWKAHWGSGQFTLHTNIHARSGQRKIPLEWKSPKEIYQITKYG